MRIDWIYSELCGPKFVCIYGRRGTIPQAKRQGVTRLLFFLMVGDTLLLPSS